MNIIARYDDDDVFFLLETNQTLLAYLLCNESLLIAHIFLLLPLVVCDEAKRRKFVISRFKAIKAS